MAAQLITESDIIDVATLCVVIFGPPGVGKTAFCQTAIRPFTLDFDKGIHRAFNRKTAMRFDTWRDVETATKEIGQCNTIVVDTAGRLLDLISADIIASNAKHGTATGGLSLQGYGALKSRFSHWTNQLRLAGKDIVLICHEREDKDGDDRIMRPDIQGGSYTEVHKVSDLIGYLYRDRSGKRFLDFNPTDRHLGKNAAAWDVMEVPELRDHPTFLADLLADAKRRIGSTAEASALAAKTVASWQAKLDFKPGVKELNEFMATPELKDMKKALKAQVWHLFESYAQGEGFLFDKTAKAFVAAPEAESAGAA